MKLRSSILIYIYQLKNKNSNNLLSFKPEKNTNPLEMKYLSYSFHTPFSRKPNRFPHSHMREKKFTITTYKLQNFSKFISNQPHFLEKQTSIKNQNRQIKKLKNQEHQNPTRKIKQSSHNLQTFPSHDSSNKQKTKLQTKKQHNPTWEINQHTTKQPKSKQIGQWFDFISLTVGKVLLV